MCLHVRLFAHACVCVCVQVHVHVTRRIINLPPSMKRHKRQTRGMQFCRGRETQPRGIYFCRDYDFVGHLLFFFFSLKVPCLCRHRTASGGADCKLGITFFFGLFSFFFFLFCRLQQHCLQMFDFRSEKLYFFTLFFAPLVFCTFLKLITITIYHFKLQMD